jgi:hypothetical protein
MRVRDRVLTDASQIRGDLIGQHLSQPKPEEVRRITAIRPRRDIAASAG